MRAGDGMSATIERTFAFTVDRAAVERRAAASKAMTPEQRAAAYEARLRSCRGPMDYLTKGVW